MIPVRTHISSLMLASLCAGMAVVAGCWAVFGMDDGVFSTIDGNIFAMLLGSIGFLALFTLAHIGLMAARITQSWGYALAGALCFLPTFLIAGGNSLLATAQAENALSMAIVIPALVGAMIGYAYHATAGRVTHGDDPDRLAQWLGVQMNLPEGQRDDLTTARIANETYYNGPVEVRTSLGLMLMAGAITSLICVGLGVLIYQLSAQIMWEMVSSVDEAMALEMAESLITPSVIFLTCLLIMICSMISLFVPNLVSHKICQYFKVTSSGGYAAIGFGVCFAMGFIIFPLLAAAPFAAVSAALYRKLAGLQPLALPEDLTVSDPRTLISENHPRRQYHRVVDVTPASRAAPSLDKAQG